MRRKMSFLTSRGTSLLLSLLVLSVFTIVVRADADSDARQKCQSSEANRDCSQCIKQHPDCAWCSDSRYNGSRRCNLKSDFEQGVCAPNQLFSPTTEIKVAPQHNLPLGGRRTDSTTPVQLEPQQVEIRMKPGDVVEVPFRYLHKIPATGYEVKDFTIQTSEFRSLGLEIEFSIDCNGERQVGRVCPGVKPDEKISFYAKVSLNDCSNTNLIAVSVGIYGYNTVSAIFVTPLCDCECTNPRFHERRSPKCGYKGNLVCGVCQCDQGKGGENCECDLNAYGVSSPEDLLNQCREHKTSGVCSGKGKCACGKCKCDADYIKGKFCECDSANCPLSVQGQLCSGKGECDCGKCVCERGWSGDDCSCSDDPTPCSEIGVTCSGNGYCECGKCSCNVGWTGARCSVEQELPEEGHTSTIAHDARPPSVTVSPASSESAEESEEQHHDDEPEHPDTTGDLLPQSQIKAGEHGDGSPDSADSNSFKLLLYVVNTLLAIAVGFYVL